MRILTTALIAFMTIVHQARTQGSAAARPPDRPDRAAHYLFYLHGKILEDSGVAAVHSEFGPYEYGAIVRQLIDSGFVVISEIRLRNTDPARYADSVAHQVQRLLAAGVPAGNVAVVGASKGAVIAMLVATHVAASVRYVLLANCNDWILQHYSLHLHGIVLSIFEASDTIGRSCRGVFAQSPNIGKHDELRLNTGLKHGFIFHPLIAWVRPTIAWARGGA